MEGTLGYRSPKQSHFQGPKVAHLTVLPRGLTNPAGKTQP